MKPPRPSGAESHPPLPSGTQPITRPTHPESSALYLSVSECQPCRLNRRPAMPICGRIRPKDDRMPFEAGTRCRDYPIDEDQWNKIKNGRKCIIATNRKTVHVGDTLNLTFLGRDGHIHSEDKPLKAVVTDIAENEAGVAEGCRVISIATPELFSRETDAFEGLMGTLRREVELGECYPITDKLLQIYHAVAEGRERR